MCGNKNKIKTAVVFRGKHVLVFTLNKLSLDTLCFISLLYYCVIKLNEMNN